MTREFNDSNLADPESLRRGDRILRPVAESGVRLRRASMYSEPALADLSMAMRPRAIVVCGPEARLLRAVLEKTSPVPCVAWAHCGLPGWVGPLDLVVALGGDGRAVVPAVTEALRRGCWLIAVCEPDSLVAQYAESRNSTILTVPSDDPLVAAIMALKALSVLGLGPDIDIETIAADMDAVAVDCSMYRSLATNPAKTLALELADTTPLVWGGQVLAARASRRIASAVRRAMGRTALAADARELVPLMLASASRDVFVDPFEDQNRDRPLSLLLLDDGHDDELSAQDRRELVTAADSRGIRISLINFDGTTDVERYVSILMRGLFTAGYLQIGYGLSE